MKIQELLTARDSNLGANFFSKLNLDHVERRVSYKPFINLSQWIQLQYTFTKKIFSS